MKPTVVDRIIRREIYKTTELGRIIDPRAWNAAQTSMATHRKGN